MRILIATTINLTVEAFLLEQLEFFRDQGHEVVVLTRGAPSDSPVSGVRTIDAPWSRPLKPTEVLAAISETRTIIDRELPDVLYVHTTVAAAITRLALRRHRSCRVVYCAHGFDGARAQPMLRRIASRAIERYLARRSDLILTMNDEDATWAATLRCATARIPSVGLDLDFYQPCPARQPTPPFLVLAVAELAPRKRPHLLIETIAALPDDYRLLIVGDGPLRDQLQDHAREHGVKHRVSIAGHLQDVRSTLCRADIVVTTSRQEGLPRSLLEAAAVGKPIVGMDARGVSDIVHQCGGVIVGHGDVDGLARAIEDLLNDPASYERARLAGIKASSEHDVSVLAPRICELVLNR